MKKLKIAIFKFLQSYCKPNLNYAIAYSGGNDSKALLYLLLDSLKKFPMNLHVLHVDHSWRKESKIQADCLESEIKLLKLKFYRHTLQAPQNKNNLEDSARKDRLLFFSNISKELKLEGIFLAHHADDLAETVLKRVLEGACLENLVGMKKISQHSSTMFFRPLLEFKKKDLQKYLNNCKLNAIDDPTNYDHKFLRARMRADILPFIESNFGKSITNNLIRLSQRSDLFSSYFYEKLKDIAIPSEKGPFGTFYDFSKVSLLHDLEVKYLLKKIIKKENLSLHNTSIDQILNHLKTKVANKRFILKEKEIICDRGTLFFVNMFNFKSEERIISTKEDNKVISSKIGWKAFFRGVIICPLPNEDINVKWFSDLNRFDQRKISRSWEKAKIPVFLRRKAPILCQNGKIMQDVLNSDIMNKNYPRFFLEWKIRYCNLIS